MLAELVVEAYSSSLSTFKKKSNFFVLVLVSQHVNKSRDFLSAGCTQIYFFVFSYSYFRQYVQWKSVFSQPAPCKKSAVKFVIIFKNKYIFFQEFWLFFNTKKLTYMIIHIFHSLRLNVAKYVLKNRKVQIINPSRNKPNTSQKHPLKVKNQKSKKKHHFLRIPVIFGVMFLFCPKLSF